MAEYSESLATFTQSRMEKNITSHDELGRHIVIKTVGMFGRRNERSGRLSTESKRALNTTVLSMLIWTEVIK